MADTDHLLKAILGLSPSQQQELFESLSANGITPNARPLDSSELLEERRFRDGLFCPRCGSRHAIRHGRQKDGTQRFRCRECGKTFQAFTKTVLGRSTPYAEKLRKYVHCMYLELSIRKCADECRISVPTAFNWRHKILDALCNNLKNCVLNGVIEFDETFFSLSFKGHRHMNSALDGGIPLPNRKRGGELVRSGSSTRQVCVPAAVSRAGGFVAQVSNLGNPKADDVANVLKGHIAPDAVFCCDGERPAKSFAAKEGLKKVVIRRGRGSKGMYNIQTVNAFHSSLKDFVNHGFNGVATKYLNNYVTWHGVLHAPGIDQKETEELLYEVAMTAVCPSAGTRVSDRESVPVLSKNQKEFMKILLLKLAVQELQDKEEALIRLRQGQYSENEAEGH